MRLTNHRVEVFMDYLDETYNAIDHAVKVVALLTALHRVAVKAIDCTQATAGQESGR